jgi:hypothetical protein
VTRAPLAALACPAAALACALAAGAAHSASQPAADGVDLALTELGFSASDIVAAHAGSIVARQIPQADDAASFVIGVARIEAREERAVAALRSVDTFRTAGRVTQSGRFESPPRAEDLEPLAFESQDLEDLRRCRVGDCDIRVDAEAMRLAAAIDWKSAGAHTQASAILKRALLGLTGDYLERGAPALWVYHESETPDDSAAAFAGLLSASPRLVALNDAFFRHVLAFPAAAPPGVEAFVYWTKERLRRPIVSVVQAFLQRVPGERGERCFVALKHIYDSHYFRAFAEFIVVLPEDGAVPQRGFYLVRSVRASIDPPRWLRGILLGRIKHEMRNALREDLASTRSRLEAATGAATPSMP